ncbi:hypothetical protein KGQ20_46515, partial [Catenulispora sp. NF23]
PYESPTPGTLGGHRRLRIYGRLDCPSALRHIAEGHYTRHRIFFADEATAIAAGYRPCARCLPEPYRVWRSLRADSRLGPSTALPIGSAKRPAACPGPRPSP